MSTTADTIAKLDNILFDLLNAKRKAEALYAELGSDPTTRHAATHLAADSLCFRLRAAIDTVAREISVLRRHGDE